MRILKVLCILSLLAIFATSCGSLPDHVTINIEAPTQDVNQIVQATFQAMTSQATVLPLSTPPVNPTLIAPTLMPATPSSSTGSISGSLNYPADAIPALYVVAFQSGTQNYQYVVTTNGQRTYQIDNLQPGNYHIVAYTVGGGGFPTGLPGGYTKAVLCGLGANCTDHSLIDVPVAPGSVSKDIDPYDFYAPQGSYDPFPGQSAASSSTPALPTAIAEGSISGHLMYPANGIPSLRIVATEVGTNNYFHVDTSLGQTSYQLDHLPSGTYHVIAYVLPGGEFTSGLPGGYSKMVPCGLAYGCNDHTLIDVVVTAGNVTTGVDPNDYYADAGTFPPDPVP